MTGRVSTLDHVALGSSNWIFLLVHEPEAATDLKRALVKEAERFGNDLGLKVQVARATSIGRAEIFEQLREKPWPDEIRARMNTDEDPFLVVLQTDFSDFDPAEHDWRIIWFREIKNPRANVPRLFEVLQREVGHEGDVFAFLDGQCNPSTCVGPYGTINSPSRLRSEVRARGPGRPGIFEPEYGLRDWIDDQVSTGNVQNLDSSRWRTEFVDRLLQALPALTENFQRKSIVRALRQKGIFDEIEPHIGAR